MSLAASVDTDLPTDIPTAAQAATSVESLVQRLADEVANATKRIHSLQTEAARAFVGHEQRFARFLALAERIEAILEPRIEAFAKIDVFKDIQQNVKLELRGPKGRGFHGRTVTLTVPSSDACLGKVELSFRLGHDSAIVNALLDYRLEILPIFIKFDSHDQLAISIDDADEAIVATWIDEKLIGFTRSYFEMYFTEQYQQKSLEIDPVMNVRFPRAFAAGSWMHRGHEYHFYTEESLLAFKRDPSEFIANG